MNAGQERIAATIGAALATTAWGAAGVITKVLDMDPLAIVAYRFTVAGIVLTLLAPAFGHRLTLRKMWLAAPAGITLAIDTALFFSAVKQTTIANATVIGALQPVLMLVLAHRLLGERITRKQVVWSFVAIGGVVFLIFGSSGLPGWSAGGDVLAMLATVLWAVYFYLVKTTQRHEISPTEFTAAVALYAGGIVGVLAVPFGQDLSWPTSESWLLLLVMAFGTGSFAHLVMNWSLVRIPVSLGSAMTLLVPVSASLGAWAFVDERITLVQLTGIGITLVSLAVIVAEQQPAHAGVDV